MTENVRKLVGVVVMAALVVVGVAVSSGDDTDFTRNRSFSSATAMSSGTAKADCCDETLALLGSIQDEVADNSSQLADNSSQLADNSSQLADNSSQLAEISSQLGDNSSQLADNSSQIGSIALTYPIYLASPWHPSYLADEIAEACPYADPANWTSVHHPHMGATCVRSAIVGWPLEAARDVVLWPGKLGFFHRWNWDLHSYASGWITSWSTARALTTDEACQPIFYGDNPQPRMAIAVDTKDGLILPLAHNSYYKLHLLTGYMQQIEHFDLLSGNPSAESKESMHWPSLVDDKGLCD
jgi:X-X-X-Leu-X-X-Gly heptad repeat protein